MLQDFLVNNRALLIDRCRMMVADRSQSKALESELDHGIPIFLDQIIKTLIVEPRSPQLRNLTVTSKNGVGMVNEVADMAAMHGQDLFEQGFTLDQVVRDYGDVCQAVTNLAFETSAPIGVEEFQTFNRCLDTAIAGAVTEFARHSAKSIESRLALSNSRLGALAHEIRNHLQTLTLAVKAIKAGNVGIAGATGAVLDRSIVGMRDLIDRSLAEVRLSAGIPPRFELIHLGKFLGEIESAASLDAQSRGLRFTVAPIDDDIAIYADPGMLSSAVGNLIQNAFKFTQRRSEVRLQARSIAGRVLIDIEDCCGGLPLGVTDTLFIPFVQSGENRSGLGLGLDICWRNVEANHGSVKVEDKPGIGCVFTINLPRHADF